jgi:predicted permease
MFQDLRFGLKLLWKEKAFTVTALLTLALCIGANTAIFSVLHAVVLEPLPFADPGRLVTLYNIYPGVGVTEHGANATPDYFDRKQLTAVFDSVSLTRASGFDIGAEGSPVRVNGEAVTPSFFRVLRVNPLRGRAFTEDDATWQKSQFAILSYGLWRQQFGGDEAILGKDVRLSGLPYRVVGIMPEGFESPGSEARIWVPLAFSPQQTTDDARHSNSWGMIARLQPGVTVAVAQRRIDLLNQQQISRSPVAKLLREARFATVVRGLRDEMVRDIRPILYLLQAAVAFVLLIGCVNVANLMLVRSNIRMKELAIRHSLGAARGRLARQLLTESVTLALLGGLLGIATGAAGVRLLTFLGTSELPRGAGIHMDSGALLFTGALAILTGLIFGSIPVYHLFRRDLNAIFRESGRTGTTGRRSLWTRSALVVCQVSLAFVLLIGAGLLAVSFRHLLAVKPGFQPQNVQSARFSLPRNRYGDDNRIRTLVGGMLNALRVLPGVTHAGAVDVLPFSNEGNASSMAIVGHDLAPGELPPVPMWIDVDPGYFQTMGISLLQGRFFTEGDTELSERVAMVDEFFAHKYLPKGNAIGSRILRGLPEAGHDPGKPCTIVGVVATVKTGDLAEQNPIGQLYFDYRQYPASTMYLVVKSRADDPTVLASVRRELMKADPELPLFDVKSMPERVSASMRDRRAAMVICVVFAALALALSAIGIYGMLAYTVSQRAREFGLRMALGAGMGNVVGMVVRQGMLLAAMGLAIGIFAAIVLTRLMATLLFSVKPADPTVFALVAAALLLVALAASSVPALRVTRIQPAIALRDE